MRSTTGRRLLWVLGVVLLVAAAVTTGLALLTVLQRPLSVADVVFVSVKLAVLLAPSLVLIWFVWRVESERYDDVLRWGVLVGAAVAAASFVTGMQYLDPDAVTAYPLLVQTLTGAGVGCLLGVLIGRHETNARVSATEAAENARVARERREDFVFLNQLLRHHVLNAVTIISGRAGLVEEHVSGEASAHVVAIRQRSDQVAGLVGTVQSVSNALAAESDAEPVDVLPVLRDVVAEYRESNPDATFSLDAPDRREVASNGALHVVFDQLVENAVEHNEGSPRVAIDVTSRGDDVDVTVADDGEGFDEAAREHAFEPGQAGDSGFGLYVVDVLVSDCGGDVAIENRDDGSAVTVTLPSP